jgi:excisionase family DNA binding protein
LAQFGSHDLVTVTQAATEIDRSRRTIYRLIREKKVRWVRLGSGRGHFYVSRTSLHEYVDSGNLAAWEAEPRPGPRKPDNPLEVVQ